MDPAQTAFGSILVVSLLGLAGYYGFRQVKNLRALQYATELPVEDRKFFSQQAYRRLMCCSLMAVFALMLLGSMLFLEDAARELGQLGEESNARAEQAVLSDGQKQFLRIYGAYWITALLVLLGIVLLAAIDLFNIRRYALHQLARIREQRRDVLLDRGRNAGDIRRNGHDL